MDNEFKLEHHISFRLRNILEIDEKSLETVDFSPDALRAVIEQYDGAIRGKMNEEKLYDREFRPTASRFLPSVILIARMALEDQLYMALNRHALVSGGRHFTHGSVLTDEALPYWNSVARTDFNPQVHFLRSTDNKTSGVWLGISEKEN